MASKAKVGVLGASGYTGSELVRLLLRHPKVVATPHVAAGSVESGQDVARGAVQNVAGILAGHWPLEENIVNADVVPRVALAPFDAALLGSAP